MTTNLTRDLLARDGMHIPGVRLRHPNRRAPSATIRRRPRNVELGDDGMVTITTTVEEARLVAETVRPVARLYAVSLAIVATLDGVDVVAEAARGAYDAEPEA